LGPSFLSVADRLFSKAGPESVASAVLLAMVGSALITRAMVGAGQVPALEQPAGFYC